VQEVEQEIQNLADAIAAGLLNSSPVLAERLHTAEVELARLHATQARHALQGRNVEKIVSGLESQFLDPRVRPRRVRAARRARRQELRGLLGPFKIEADDREIRFYNKQGHQEAAFLRAVGADDVELR
jgi:hypothetical protein